jgi:hypothetical protein
MAQITNGQLLLVVVHSWWLILLVYAFVVILATVAMIIVDWLLGYLDWYEILDNAVYGSTVVLPVTGVLLLLFALGINSISTSWFK